MVIESPGSTQADAQAAPTGFVRYVSENYGFSIYHPDHWIATSYLFTDEESALVDDAVREMLLASFEEDVVSLPAAAAHWFDLENSSDTILASTNIIELF